MKHVHTISRQCAAPAQNRSDRLFDLFVAILVEFELAKTRKATGG